MYLCELMPIFYGLSWRLLMIMNDLDWQKKRIGFMNELYGWTRVNVFLYGMDSPGGFSWEWTKSINRKTKILYEWTLWMDSCESVSILYGVSWWVLVIMDKLEVKAYCQIVCTCDESEAYCQIVWTHNKEGTNVPISKIQK